MTAWSNILARLACIGVMFLGALTPEQAAAQVAPEHPTLPNLDKRWNGSRNPRELSPSRRVGLENLHGRVPGLEVQWDDVLQTPKSVYSNRALLTGPEGVGGAVSQERLQRFDPSDKLRVLKAFLDEHRALFSFGSESLESAKLERDDLTPHNQMRSVVWRQQLDGVEVFDGVFIGHLTRRQELVALSSQFVAGLESRVSPGQRQRLVRGQDFPVAPTAAILGAAQAIEEGGLNGESLRALDNAPQGAERRQRFKASPLPGDVKVRLVWFPWSELKVVLAWEVALTRRLGSELFRVLIDVQSGELLARHCLTMYAREASYRVYTSDSPAPLSPAYATPTTNQAPYVERQLVSLTAISTNASPTGWIHEFENETFGNNVDAHLDRDADNEPDLPRPSGSPERVFDFPLDLSQSPWTHGDASAVQLFYWCNWMHDRLYELGFTEAAGNFQRDNFGRGGLGNDPVQADAQDGSGFNNANFTPSQDGEPGRIQMFLFNGVEPNRDGSLDADIILHEYAHGLSYRLVGGGSGFYQLQTYGMAEGWSDFYALALLSEPGDDPHGNYVEGGYSTYLFSGLKENYYFGIRRYPYTTDLSKNPLTFKDIDPNQIESYPEVPRSPIQPFNPVKAGQVHRQGEIWCVTLWEARANLIDTYGFETGNHLILQLVTDGMKLSPPNPTFLQARDAILLADRVTNEGANQYDLWRAFAKRGMGLSAVAPPNSTTEGVKEAFDMPDLLTVTPLIPLRFAGPIGTVPVPSCRVLTLRNPSQNTISWEAFHEDVWLDLVPGAGLLAPGQTTNVSVCLNDTAALLETGAHLDLITISNRNTGNLIGRTARADIVRAAEMPFLEDFEDDGLGPYWLITGTGIPRAEVSYQHHPHAGEFHLEMSSGENGLASRNESTLYLDLEGYTNVVLRFWARQFHELPHAPPENPFEDGADFDGVAVSADGIQWLEVLPLRGLESYDTEQVVALDSLLAGQGIPYNSAFRIRFNQYGENLLPAGGIALDDISVSGIAPRRFTVELMSEFEEGQGTLPQAGWVRLGAPAAQTVAVQLVSSDPTELMLPDHVTIAAGTDAVAFPVTVVDDDQLDGTQRVVLSATAAGHIGASASATVTDNEAATLRLLIPLAAREGDGVLPEPGYVTVDQAPEVAIDIVLLSSDPGEFSVPSRVTLPAGQTSVSFPMTVVDDGRIDGAKVVTVTATVKNWVSASATISIGDNENNNLFLLVPTLLPEEPITLSSVGQLFLSGYLTNDLVVALRSSEESLVRVPTMVTLRAGNTQVKFSITTLQDEVARGPVNVQITASAAGFNTGGAIVRVIDAESAPLPFGPHPPHQSANNPTQLALSWALGDEQLLVNGDFERGDLTAWSVAASVNGTFVLNEGQVDPLGPEGPSAPYQGNFSALSEQMGPGRQELSQDVLLPLLVDRLTLSWAHRIRNHASTYATNQTFRVEVRDGSNRTLAVLYSTQQGEALLREWETGQADVTAWRGQRVRIVFVEVDELGFLNVQVDEVKLYAGYDFPTMSEVYFGPSSIAGDPPFLGVTTNRTWALPTLAPNLDYAWRVVARRDAVRMAGPVWQFRTRGLGALHEFVWEPIDEIQQREVPFPVALTARDDLGNVLQDFYGSVRLRATRQIMVPAVQVLSYVEYADLDRRFRNTLGAVATWFTNFAHSETTATDPSTLQSLLVGKDVFLIPAQTFVPGGYMRPLGESWRPVLQSFVANGGVVVACSYNKDEYNLMQASGLLSFDELAKNNPATALDLVPNPADPLARGVSAPFTGYNIVTFNSDEPGIAVRSTDKNLPVVLSRSLGSGLAVLIGSDYATNRTAMDRIIANAVAWAQNQDAIGVPMTPSQSGFFLQGRWQGEIALQDTGLGVSLIAESDQGPFGISNPFEIISDDDLSVSVRGQPDPIFVGQTVTYSIEVRYTGLGLVQEVLLTNQIPDGLDFVSVSESPSRCELGESGRLRCQLGTMGSGTTFSLTVTGRAWRAGTLTNIVDVVGSEAEVFLKNNRATAVTRVNPPSLSIGNVSVSESQAGSSPAIFPVRLFPPSGQTVVCAYASADVTAETGSDYVAVSGFLVFSPGVTNQTISVPLLGDNLNEANENFRIDLFDPVNASILLGQGYAALQDDDPVPTLSIDNILVTEGGLGTTTNAVFHLALSARSGRDVTVNYSILPESATALADFIPASGILTFPAGTTEQSLTVVVVGDDLAESNETFQVEFYNPVGTVLPASGGEGVIVDDDVARLDHFQFDPIALDQSLNAPFPIRITARDSLGRLLPGFGESLSLVGLTEQMELSAAPGAGLWPYLVEASYHDHRMQSIYLAQDFQGPARLTALAVWVGTPVAQRLQHWTVRLKHTPLSGYDAPAWESEGWTTVYQQTETLLESGWHWMSFIEPFLYNGLDSLLVDFSFNNGSFGQNGQVRFAVTELPRSIYFSTDSGFGDPLLWQGSLNPTPTTTNGVPSLMFRTEKPVAITPSVTGPFVDGAWAGAVTVLEPVPEMRLRARDADTHAGLANAFAVTAKDDLAVHLSVNPDPLPYQGELIYTITITNTGPSAATEVRLTNSVPAGLTFIEAAPSQGACDYVGGEVRCSFGTMASESRSAVSLRFLNTLTGLVTNRVSVARRELEAYLPNNQATLVSAVTPPGLAIDDATVDEGDEGLVPVNLRVRLSHAVQDTVTVRFATFGGTATNIDLTSSQSPSSFLTTNLNDFVLADGWLDFPPGTTEQSIVVSVIGDTRNETEEFFTVQLSQPTNAILSKAQGVVTILDADPFPRLRVNDISQVEGNEGSRSMMINVSLSQDSGQLVRVDYATSNLTALTGFDYQARNGNLLFPRGITNRIVFCPIVGDLEIEPDETFAFHLFNPQNATVETSVATMTILNDDGLPGVLDHFEWGTVNPGQILNVPFAGSLTARDSQNRMVTNFNGYAWFTAREGLLDRTVGYGDVAGNSPLRAGYHDARAQYLYLASELGGASRLRGLALEVLQPPVQTLHEFTVRLQHTPRFSFSTSLWEGSGWTTVLRTNVWSVPTGEWILPFDTVFDYNGTSNLLVDVSFNNSYFTIDGIVQGFTTNANRALIGQSDSQHGNPLNWSGTDKPTPNLSTWLPNLRFLRGVELPMEPALPIVLAGGLWMGDISIHAPGTNLSLVADDEAGHMGISDSFSVLDNSDTDRDGLPDDWEVTHFGSIMAPGGGPDDDPDEDGASNRQEYETGTNPRDPRSLFQVTEIFFVGTDLHVRFATVNGYQYRVERSDGLSETSWKFIGNLVSGNGAVAEVVDKNAAFQRSTFYRVRLEPGGGNNP